VGVAASSLAALYEGAQLRCEAFGFVLCQGFGYRFT
jgi:hypothetical protein